MATISSIVRERAGIGTADYSLAGTAYWTDSQIASALVQNRGLIVEAEISWLTQTGAGGTPVYTLAELEDVAGLIEPGGPGTAGTMIDRNNGGTITGWTLDASGLIAFGTSTGGTANYAFTGYAYDVNATAADILEAYAAHVADEFDFSTDDQSFNRSTKQSQLLAQAARLRERATIGGAGIGGISDAQMVRTDI